jgi:nicotinamide-nucleotide amidase
MSTQSQLLIELAESVGKKLAEKKWQLVTAESCTGGGVGAVITEVSGSSVWYDRGFITYSNAAKIEMLGVPAALIAEHGAVSEPVAQAMAQGALQYSNANVSLAITGIAGPGGDTAEKPVGTVCFAWSLKARTIHSETKHFRGARADVRAQAIEYSLITLLTLLPVDH